jgi:hypothetical protein
LTDPEKCWYQDDEFLSAFYRLEDHALTIDRKYALTQVLKLTDSVAGDTAECGVYFGSSSWFICNHFKGSGRMHHGFDSFEGLSQPAPVDGPYWRRGDLVAAEDAARRVMQPFSARLYPGWIPDRFFEVEGLSFAFVHIDVDLYTPTRDSMEFFYPRLSPGGIVLCDDYGFATCPGARQAMDEYMAVRPEPVIELPTGQGLVIKTGTIE